MAATADLIVRVIADTSRAKGIDTVGEKTGKFSKGLAVASKVAAGALVAVGGAAISAAQAAAEDQASQEALSLAMQKNAGASASQIKATEDWISKMSAATGVADDELRPALATLVRATGDVEKSQKALSVAMDVSAATGKPLSAVTAAMAKGFAGSTTSLGRLVPGLSAAALKSGDMGRVMYELKKKTGGAAKAAGETAAGKMARFKLSLQETQEAAGAALLPALTKLTGVLVKVGNWAQNHGTLFTVIAAGIAVMAVAVLALNVAMTVYTAVTTLAGSATLMAWAAALWPILLVIAAIAAVVAIVVILWKKSNTFRTIVLAVWSAIKTAAAATGRVIMAVWQGVVAGARKMGAAVKAIWQAIKAAARAVTDGIKAAWGSMVGKVKSLLSGLRTMAVAVWQAIKDKATGITSAIKTAFESMKTKVNSVFTAVKSAIGGAVTKAGELIRKLADIVVPGGVKTALDGIKTVIDNIVTAIRNMISAIKDIPVPHINWPSPPKWFDKVMPGMAPASAGATGFGAYAAPGVRGPMPRAATPGGAVVININGALDPEHVARQIGRILDGHDRRVRGRPL